MRFSIIILLFFLLTPAVFAADIELKLSKGVTFTFNMLQMKPGDPNYFGPPIILSASPAEIIQSATIWINLEPFRAESIESIQPDEFDIDFTQENQIVKININRTAFRNKEGSDILQIIHDRINLFGDIDLYFGKFEFLQTEIKTVQFETPTTKTIDGTWQATTDYFAAFNIRLVRLEDEKPLENFGIFIRGYGTIPDFYESPVPQLPTNEEGKTYVIFQPDPAGLYIEQDGCYIPTIESMDFWLQIDPPDNTNYNRLVKKVTVPLRVSCGEYSPFEDIILKLEPLSFVNYFELFLNENVGLAQSDVIARATVRRASLRFEPNLFCPSHRLEAYDP